MIDFIVAGFLYLGIMSVAAFSFSVLTIGITFSVAVCLKRCFARANQPNLWLSN